MPPWPTQSDYKDSLQNPDTAFRDPDLRASQAERSPMPELRIVVLAIVAGAWLVVIGITQIVWAFQARKAARTVEQGIGRLTSAAEHRRGERADHVSDAPGGGPPVAR